jgi:hypothetical protein
MKQLFLPVALSVFFFVSVLQAQSWECVTATAQWAARSDHSSIVFNGEMWVLRGLNSSGSSLYDIWSSTDGQTWTGHGTAGSMDMTYCFPTVAFNGFMLTMGGATC